MRLIFSFLVLLVIASTFISCQKESTTTGIYGQWKTSYGDTIIFSKENGKDILTYDQSLNANRPVETKIEFTYSDNKLGIMDGLNGNDFRILQSFKWKQHGKSFEVQGIEWFLFVNSTTTYFTFTKI